MKGKVGTLIKAMNLLNTLGERGPMGVMDLSRMLDMEKSGVSRLLTTLKSEDYVRVLIDGRYDLGLRLFELGQILQERMPIRRSIIPHVEALARESGETASSAHYHQRYIAYLHDVISEKEIRMGGRVGIRCLPWKDVCGKVILAHCEEEYVLECLKFDRMSGHRPLPSPKAILLELEKIRSRGFAAETTREHSVVAAHIPSEHRPPSLAMFVGGPSSRIKEANIPDLGIVTALHAKQAAESLGWKK